MKTKTQEQKIAETREQITRMYRDIDEHKLRIRNEAYNLSLAMDKDMLEANERFLSMVDLLEQWVRLLVHSEIALDSLVAEERHLNQMAEDELFGVGRDPESWSK